MENKKLHSIGGLFTNTNDLIKATEKVVENGYKEFDVNTPFPVHGLDKAMRLKSSPMGYFALAFGLAGTITALLTISFMMVYDYPLNIGGKPIFPLPAFIPVTFELTVLFAAIGTVVGLLFIFFKFPNLSNPLHETHYLKSCTTDMFGIHIESNDIQFDEDKVVKFLEEIGATNIEKIYYYEEEKIPIFSQKFIGFLVLSIIIISGATYFVTNKLMFMTPFDWMMNQDRMDVQSTTALFDDGFSGRNKVAGTVPKDFIPEEFKDSPEQAGKYLTNPLEYNEENIILGKEKYDIFCTPCHGIYAKGVNNLADNFPKPPTLHSKKLREWSDGRIYHVITYGQGVMPSYASQVTREERWAIIQYIRTLQRAFNPKEEDFDGAK